MFGHPILPNEIFHTGSRVMELRSCVFYDVREQLDVQEASFLDEGFMSVTNAVIFMDIMWKCFWRSSKLSY